MTGSYSRPVPDQRVFRFNAAPAETEKHGSSSVMTTQPSDCPGLLRRADISRQEKSEHLPCYLPIRPSNIMYI